MKLLCCSKSSVQKADERSARDAAPNRPLEGARPPRDIEQTEPFLTGPILKKPVKHTDALPSSDTATSSADEPVPAKSVAVKSASDDSEVSNNPFSEPSPPQAVADSRVLTLPDEPPNSDSKSIAGEFGLMYKRDCFWLFFGDCCEGMCSPGWPCGLSSQKQVEAQPEVIDATTVVMEKLQGCWMDAHGEQHTIDVLSQMVDDNRRKASPFSFENDRIAIHGKRRKKEGTLQGNKIFWDSGDKWIKVEGDQVDWV